MWLNGLELFLFGQRRKKVRDDPKNGDEYTDLHKYNKEIFIFIGVAVLTGDGF